MREVHSGGTTLISAMPTPLAGVPVAVEDIPEDNGFTLDLPLPNPTAATAALTLTIARTQAVEVGAYDVVGRRVAVLLARTVAAGETVLRLDASALPAGVYVVRARGEHFTAARRITVVR